MQQENSLEQASAPGASRMTRWTQDGRLIMVQQLAEESRQKPMAEPFMPC